MSIVYSLVTYVKMNLIIYYPPPCSAHVFEALGATVKTDMQGGQMKICAFVFPFLSSRPRCFQMHMKVQP